MAENGKSNRRRRRRLRVGDRGRLRIAGRRIVVRVVEDRGNIGVGGRRLLRIEQVRDPYDIGAWEVPAQDVTPI